MSLRILWVTSDFYPDAGGIETYTEQVTDQLVRQGHYVGLVTTTGQSLPAASRLQKHFQINSLDRPATLDEVRNVRSGLAHAISSVEPDLVHFASAGLAVYSDALPDGLPRVATIHGNDLTKPWQTLPKEDPAEAIRKGLARCDKLFCVSRHTASLLASLGLKDLVQVVTNACDSETFAPVRIDRQEVLSQYGIRSGATILLTVARLVPRKGHLTVLAALRHIKRPVHWIVVGRGRLKRSLWWRHLLAGRRSQITFAGVVSTRELVELYNACHVFVLTPVEIRKGRTLDSEGFGLAFLEAGACGRPVVGSNVSGCIDAVADEQTGLLVEPDNPVALAHAITRLIDDPALREQLGGEARRRIQISGGWASVARQISREYEIAINSARAAR